MNRQEGHQVGGVMVLFWSECTFHSAALTKLTMSTGLQLCCTHKLRNANLADKQRPRLEMQAFGCINWIILPDLQALRHQEWKEWKIGKKRVLVGVSSHFKDTNWTIVQHFQRLLFIYFLNLWATIIKSQIVLCPKMPIFCGPSTSETRFQKEEATRVATPLICQLLKLIVASWREVKKTNQRLPGCRCLAPYQSVIHSAV